MQESAANGMSVHFIEGFEFDNGYLSPYMVTNPASLEAVVDEPYLLLCSEKITKVQQLMPLLDKIMRSPRPLVILAENVEGTALSMLVHNHVNGVFQSVAVRAPGFGDRRLHKLEDIATITGGAVYSKHSGFTLETMTIEQLGRAAQVRVTADKTAIIGGYGSADDLDFRLGQLRAELERATFGMDEDVLTERIGALSGKVAMIDVGAPTPAELKELQHRVEDALAATRAAMAEGIVAGGGAALLHAQGALDDLQVKGRLRHRGADRPRGAHRARVPDRGQRGLFRCGGGGPAPAAGPGRGFRRPAGPLREHDRDGHHRPAAGGPVRAAERRVRGRPAAHHQHAGGRGADAVGRQPGADDRVRPAGRRPEPAVAGFQHPAVARPRPVGRLRRPAHGGRARPAPASLPAAGQHSTLRRLRSRGRLRGAAALLGPAFVASVAYVDPGNFATNVTAGADFGYALAWVIVAANLMAMLVQYLSAKVGVATGHDLPELRRALLPRPVSRGLWVQAELIAMATDLAEFVGAALGLNLLFHVPLRAAGPLTALVAFGILAMQQRGYRRFELAIAGLLGVVFLGFAYDLFAVNVDPAALARGLVPGFAGPGGPLLAAGIIGATVMPHVIYLHSALTKSRVPCRDDDERRELLRFQRLDVIIALGAAGLINLAMLVVAAVPASRPAAGLDTSRARRAGPAGRRRGGARVRRRAARVRAVLVQRRHLRRPGRHAGLHPAASRCSCAARSPCCPPCWCWSSACPPPAAWSSPRSCWPSASHSRWCRWSC